jgi:predicted dehydrogenase
MKHISKYYKTLSSIIQNLFFCEKPLALSYEDVQQIVSLYKEKNIYLQVNFTRRFLKEFYEIEKIISDGKLGQLESVTFYYSRGLIHNASHYLDLINWFIGETEQNLVNVSTKKESGTMMIRQALI